VTDDGSLQQVTAAEAVELADAGTLLIDVREQDEWDAGHAPQAVHMPMSRFADYLDELPDDDEFLVICRSGGRSLTVATALAERGYHPVDVVGGMMAWQQGGGPVVHAPLD
jgi:rhodanese-related sulfurtransferase